MLAVISRGAVIEIALVQHVRFAIRCMRKTDGAIIYHKIDGGIVALRKQLVFSPKAHTPCYRCRMYQK